jgi:hypothetical protein
MAASLLESFENLDQGTKDILADIDKPSELALMSLYIACKRFETPQMSAEHIVACLELAGVGVTKKSIGRALASAKGLVTRSIGEDGDVVYRLMTRGAREAEHLLSAGGGLSVIRIESGLPRQARLKLGEILKTLSGVVRVCDPFYGVSTLDSLDLIPVECDVRFLSQKGNDSDIKMSGALRDFYRERNMVELRKCDLSIKLHDRYIVTKDSLLLLGHGIKDIGNKESFIVCIDKKLAPDLIDDVISSFDNNWGGAQKI